MTKQSLSWLTAIFSEKKSYHPKRHLLINEARCYEETGTENGFNFYPTGAEVRKYSVEVLGEQVGESKSQIQRYIRLTELIPEILEMVDDKKISMRPAVELSYLPKEEQEILYDTMESEACTPSHAQAIKIRKFSAEGRLNEDVLLSIMSEEKPNQVEQWKIPKNRLKNTFHRELHSRKWKKPLSKHWNYTGNGKKQGTIGILTPREKSIRWRSMRISLLCFPSPHPTPFVYQQITSRKDNKEPGTSSLSAGQRFPYPA